MIEVRSARNFSFVEVDSKGAELAAREDLANRLVGLSGVDDGKLLGIVSF